MSATNLIVGVDAVAFAKIEATYDTVQAFAATDAVNLVDPLKLDGEKVFEPTKEHVGTASEQAMIAGLRGGKWHAKSYLRPAAAGTPPDITDLLKAVFTESISGGVSVTYALNDSAPGSLGLMRKAGSGLYEVASGGWVEQLELDFQQNAMPTIALSGGYASMGWAYGCDLAGIINAGAGSGTYNTSHKGNLAKGAVVAFGAKNNSGVGYTITAVDNTVSPGTFTFTPVMESGGTGAADAITPLTPAMTTAGGAIGGISASLTVDGATVNFLKGKITIKTGYHPRNKEITQDRPTGAIRGRREITGEFDCYFLDRETAPIIGRAWDGVGRTLALRLGPNTAAARCKINIPKAWGIVTPIEIPDDVEGAGKISWRALQSAAAADEFNMVFD